MNSSSSFSPAAEEQAALWAARLDGSTLGAPDRLALDAWLAADPVHRTLLSNYCQFSADLEQQLPLLVASGAIQMPTKKTASAARRSRPGWFSGLAFAAAAAVAFGIWYSQPSRHFQTLATAAAHRQSVTLADGSRVELNARTELIVENGPAERRVRLTQGEAFFTVSKDPTRPFIVETPAGSVRVTGTMFNVRLEKTASLDVVVAEGSVQVNAGPSSDALKSLRAGDHLTALDHNVSVVALTPAIVAEKLAWRQGQIVFHDLPLAEAVAQLARYHGHNSFFSDAVLAANKHVGSTYALDDLEGTLAGIADSQAVRILRDAKGDIRVALKTER